MEGIRLYNQWKHDYPKRDKHGTDKEYIMEKNLPFPVFVIVYVAKEFVINVKNRLITVINAVS